MMANIKKTMLSLYGFALFILTHNAKALEYPGYSSDSYICEQETSSANDNAAEEIDTTINLSDLTNDSPHEIENDSK